MCPISKLALHIYLNDHTAYVRDRYLKQRNNAVVRNSCMVNKETVLIETVV